MNRGGFCSQNRLGLEGKNKTQIGLKSLNVPIRLLIVLLTVLIFTGCSSKKPKPISTPAPVESPIPVPTPVPAPPPAPTPIPTPSSIVIKNNTAEICISNLHPSIKPDSRPQTLWVFLSQDVRLGMETWCHRVYEGRGWNLK